MTNCSAFNEAFDLRLVTQCATVITNFLLIKEAPQIYAKSIPFAWYRAACQGYSPSFVDWPCVISGVGCV